MELDSAPLLVGGARVGRGRSGDPVDAGALNGVFEVDAGSETIA